MEKVLAYVFMQMIKCVEEEIGSGDVCGQVCDYHHHFAPSTVRYPFLWENKYSFKSDSDYFTDRIILKM